MTSALSPEPYELEGEVPYSGSPKSNEDVARTLGHSNAAHRVVSGTSALAVGVLIERGTGFIANICAARLGGAGIFGQYSLAISTANNIATYAGAGIGSTAARFSGKYPFEGAAYGTLARVLTLVSVASSLLAGLGLWLGAAPIAHLLGKDGLVGLLRWSALSAMGMVILECARGFFVGQRRLRALIVLSLIVGIGMLSLVPYAALKQSPVRMISYQGAITTSAVLVCLMLARPLHLLAKSRMGTKPPFSLVLREVWGFGLVQLAGLAGANAAGWWLVTLVARADTSFVQMGFFGIASQLRNIVGLAPGLLTEGSFAVMADPEGQTSSTPQRVLGFTTFVASVLTFLLASAGIIVAPWLLRLLYSHSYVPATSAVAFALALAVMHMGNAPAAARLSIISIRSSAVINSVWAVFVAVAGTLVMLHSGSAVMAMIIYLSAHTLSSCLVLLLLARKDSLPAGLVGVFAVATMTTLGLACMASLRFSFPGQTWSITLGMFLLSGAALAALVAMGRNHQWVPTQEAWQRLAKTVMASLPQRRRQTNAS